MKAIILALIPIACVAIGFWLGRMKTPASKHYEQMYKVAGKRAEKAEFVIDNLSDQATEHAMLGDSFAVIAQDEIRKYRRSEGQLS